MAAASEVEISTGMGKDDRSANNMIDLSLLNEVDVTCSYTSVGKDVQVVLSQEALVMKQTLTEGWDSNFRYPASTANHRNCATALAVSWCRSL